MESNEGRSVSDAYSIHNEVHDRLFGILDRVATLNKKGMEVLDNFQTDSQDSKKEESN